MRLHNAIEILSDRRGEATTEETTTALGIAITALKERLEAAQDDAASVAGILRKVFPTTGRMAAWRLLRPLLRLCPDVLYEVERLLAAD